MVMFMVIVMVTVRDGFRIGPTLTLTLSAIAGAEAIALPHPNSNPNPDPGPDRDPTRNLLSYRWSRGNCTTSP